MKSINKKNDIVVSETINLALKIIKTIIYLKL